SMKALLISALLMASAHAQADPELIPKMRTVGFRSGSSLILRLSLGYISAVHVPEPVSSIAVGDPSAFHAEHSDAEPDLVFFKPVSAEPARSNAVIVTRNGTVLTLALVSYGRAPAGSEIDFLLNCRRSDGAVIVQGSENTPGRPSLPAINANGSDQNWA